MRSDAERNQEQLMRAATASFHREGLHVPMATIAAEAGVGVGTLYRHFPNREELLQRLTHRSFEQVLANARAAEGNGESATDTLRLFIEAAISQRNELVLPLHGGPTITSAATIAVRDEVRQIVQKTVDGGIRDASLRPDTTTRDIVSFGAMLAQPRPDDPTWDTTCRRLLTTYLRGLRPDP